MRCVRPLQDDSTINAAAWLQHHGCEGDQCATIGRVIKPRTMAKQLKTYTTSAGFFDLAIAAPSMKAALEAWGSRSNLFQQGFAQQSEDPDIVAATMARPGVVLRRPVGTSGRFSEDAELPSNFLAGNARRKPEKAPTKKGKPASRRVDEKAARQAAFAFEEEQRRRERQARKEEAEWKRDQK